MSCGYTVNRFKSELEYIACKLADKNLQIINPIPIQILLNLFFNKKNTNILQTVTNVKLDMIKDFRDELSDMYQGVSYDHLIYSIITNKKNMKYIMTKLYLHRLIDNSQCYFGNVGYRKQCYNPKEIGTHMYHNYYHTN